MKATEEMKQLRMEREAINRRINDLKIRHKLENAKIIEAQQGVKKP